MGLTASQDVADCPYDESCPSWTTHRGFKELADPRSPSSTIDRTPIQVGAAVSPSSRVGLADSKTRTVGEAASYSPTVNLDDPRSPSLGVDRTPLSVSAEVNTMAQMKLETFVTPVDPSASETDSPGPVKKPQPSEPLPYLPCTDSVGETEGSRPEVEQSFAASPESWSDTSFGLELRLAGQAAQALPGISIADSGHPTDMRGCQATKGQMSKPRFRKAGVPGLSNRSPLGTLSSDNSPSFRLPSHAAVKMVRATMQSTSPLARPKSAPHRISQDKENGSFPFSELHLNQRE